MYRPKLAKILSIKLDQNWSKFNQAWPKSLKFQTSLAKIYQTSNKHGKNLSKIQSSLAKNLSNFDTTMTPGQTTLTFLLQPDNINSSLQANFNTYIHSFKL